jgi:site-specific DNA-adenine methylase
MKTKSALSYFGSDSEVAPQIAQMLDQCKHVTIPFCGGLSILPHLNARAIVANDMHAAAINYYRVAAGVHGADEQQALIDQCMHTLSHPDELYTAEKHLQGPGEASRVERAKAFWVLCWVTRKGQGGTKNQGGMPSVRRKATGGTNATRIKAAASDIEAWAKQFERCEWEQVDFRVLLPKVADEIECGVYCDPPWVGAGAAYLHNFTEQDHIDLATQLERFELATVVVRYGDHPLIRDLYGDWIIRDAASRAQCGKDKPEIWITNNASAAMPAITKVGR